MTTLNAAPHQRGVTDCDAQLAALDEAEREDVSRLAEIEGELDGFTSDTAALVAERREIAGRRKDREATCSLIHESRRVIGRAAEFADLEGEIVRAEAAVRAASPAVHNALADLRTALGALTLAAQSLREVNASRARATREFGAGAPAPSSLAALVGLTPSVLALLYGLVEKRGALGSAK